MEDRKARDVQGHARETYQDCSGCGAYPTGEQQPARHGVHPIKAALGWLQDEWDLVRYRRNKPKFTCYTATPLPTDRELEKVGLDL